MSGAAVDPQALHPDITRALREAFGDQPVEDVSALTAGRSGAVVLSVRVAGASYVARRADPTRQGHAFRIEREMTCLKLAAEAGVAPGLRHMDVQTGVSIMDRVEVDPSLPRARRIEQVARTLRRLHEGPAFPRGPSILFVLDHVEEVLRSRRQEGMPERLVRTMRELAALTAPFAETAPCHNDLNPGNVLEARDSAFFVDWETACTGDPFFDLAELGVFSFPLLDEHERLLGAYLDRRPTELERARATVGRVMALGFYATAFIYSTVLGGGTARVTVSPVSIREMLTRLGTSREQTSCELVAASLLEEMRRESETDAFHAARRALAPGG